ncbi:EcsC family protein [Georgenia muralis]|uniref:EcsC family protein n=2 Tax=Georgenia muralis TaxID=154117 RepID=A0A3N4ZAQ7_9MICO|nr:EcsC family protein [Georgenia muralis]
MRRGGQAATRAGNGLSTVAKQARKSVPESAQSWFIDAGRSTTKMVTRVARVGLSPDRVVSKHQARGHNVHSLLDVRALDLQQVDEVRGRLLGLAYPAAAATSGAAAALVITGGELTGAMSGGAAAAPSGGAIAAASASDIATVMGLSSRAVGHVALLYGYDPEDPNEKPFIWSVINVGTAMSASAKQAAMKDLSRLTQALFRGKTWQVLNESVLSRAYVAFAKAFGTRATKQSLGKFLPAVGVIMGAGFNWATLESIVDAAEFAYRRRFLMDKYPHLDSELFLDVENVVPEDHDQAFSVVEQLTEVIGHDPFGSTALPEAGTRPAEAIAEQD